jgi:hypothetical protein
MTAGSGTRDHRSRRAAYALVFVVVVFVVVPVVAMLTASA